MTPSILNVNSVATMTSLELLDLINQQRANSGRSKIRHNNFSQSIRSMFGRHVISESVPRTNGVTLKVVALSEDQARQVFSHYATGSISYGAMEHGALCAIEQVLGVTLARQYPCGPYRIDGYDQAGKVAYEIDERHHSTQNEDDTRRQKYIERELGCRFVRVEV